MSTRRSTAILIAALAMLAGCKRNPIERLVNPYNDTQVPGTSGVMTIYDDELKTAGAVGFIPFGENQSINFSDQSSPRRTSRQVRYTWNGLDTSSSTPGGFQHLFAGFSLFTEETIEDTVVNPGRNLSAGGYSRLKLWVRGTLAEGNRLRIEGPDDGTEATATARVELTSSQLSADTWREVDLPVPLVDFQSVKVYLTVSIQYDQPPRTDAAGGGATVFLDDIRYE